MEFLLCTLNAKYLHASLGLRWLYANLGDVQSRCSLLEFDINQPVRDVVEAIFARRPRVIGFGVYIWNVEQTTAVIRMLKALDPSVVVVLGGPEVSHETEGQEIVALADHVICGEGEIAFAELCRSRPAEKIIKPPLPDLEKLTFPWDAYSDEDLRHRLLYVEASRGCPYRCEFCLSSLDEKVRALPLERFLVAMQRLLDRGARTFKFVDRTFNLDVKQSQRILEFFLERMRPGLFLHFEMVPDRLPPALRAVIERFPPGVLQFEVGIQTLNPEVEKLISRQQNHARLEDNLRWLQTTNVHVHADLIVGLPGEDVSSFARGFDRLVALGPQEIQVGVLKRLKGTPITRHEGMVYSPLPPYEVLRTPSMSFEEISALRRFAKTWDLFANSGNFKLSLPHVLGAKPFEAVMRLSEKVGQATGIALTRRFRMMFEALCELMPRQAAAELLFADYQRVGKSDRPTWLDSLPDATLAEATFSGRQERHRA